MDLLHTYNDMAGRICKMWRDYSYTVRPYVLTVEAGGRKRCATYRSQDPQFPVCPETRGNQRPGPADANPHGTSGDG